MLNISAKYSSQGLNGYFTWLHFGGFLGHKHLDTSSDQLTPDPSPGQAELSALKDDSNQRRQHQSDVIAISLERGQVQMKCYRAIRDLFTTCGQKASTVDSSLTHSQHFVLTALGRGGGKHPHQSLCWRQVIHCVSSFLQRRAFGLRVQKINVSEVR